MTRETWMATKKDLKKKGLDEYFNYRPKSADVRVVLEVGTLSDINKYLERKFGLQLIMQGADREGFYLFRLTSKTDKRSIK